MTVSVNHCALDWAAIQDELVSLGEISFKKPMNKYRKCGNLDLEGVCMEKCKRPTKCLHIILFLNDTIFLSKVPEVLPNLFQKTSPFSFECKQSQGSSWYLLSVCSFHFKPLMSSTQTFSAHAY